MQTQDLTLTQYPSLLIPNDFHLYHQKFPSSKLLSTSMSSPFIILFSRSIPSSSLPQCTQIQVGTVYNSQVQVSSNETQDRSRLIQSIFNTFDENRNLSICNAVCTQTSGRETYLACGPLSLELCAFFFGRGGGGFTCQL